MFVDSSHVCLESGYCPTKLAVSPPLNVLDCTPHVVRFQSSMQTVKVVGAGFSGLVTAYYLVKEGF